MTAPFDELFNGLLSRTRQRQFTITGPASASEISNVGNLSATVHLTQHLRFVDTFNYWAYRIPENSNFTETDWTVPGSGTCAAPSCSLLIPLSATTQTVTDTVAAMSFNQKWKKEPVRAGMGSLEAIGRAGWIPLWRSRF